MRTRRVWFLAGLFLTTLTTLTLEILDTRLLSVLTWYHLSFFAVSLAMLGMAAGAVHVFLGGARFSGDSAHEALARWSTAFALSVPISHVANLCIPIMIPIEISTTTVARQIFRSNLSRPIQTGNVGRKKGIAMQGISWRRVAKIPIGRELLMAGVTGMLLASCAPIDGLEYDSPQTKSDYRRNTAVGENSSIFGGSGLSIFGGDDEAAGAAGSPIPVNGYLWRATLDTLSFLPLSSADPFGGVIITDWYAPPESVNERFKMPNGARCSWLPGRV